MMGEEPERLRARERAEALIRLAERGDTFEYPPDLPLAMAHDYLALLAEVERLAGERDLYKHEMDAANERFDREAGLRRHFEAECERLAGRVARAAHIEEHLFAMIDPQTWRDSGGDDGQGHYEGEYRAEQIQAEIAALADVGGPE